MACIRTDAGGPAKTKPWWFYNQSGVIPYRVENDEVEILLITSRRRKRWIIPKGIIERDMSPQESAAKEALEEAGVKGRVHAIPLGEYQYKKWNGTCNVAVFPFAVDDVLETWSESGVRQRRWVSVEDATGLVDEDALKHLIRRIPTRIRSGTDSNTAGQVDTA